MRPAVFSVLWTETSCVDHGMFLINIYRYRHRRTSWISPGMPSTSQNHFDRLNSGPVLIKKNLPLLSFRTCQQLRWQLPTGFGSWWPCYLFAIFGKSQSIARRYRDRSRDRLDEEPCRKKRNGCDVKGRGKNFIPHFFLYLSKWKA